jgi:hypothetical protein
MTKPMTFDGETMREMNEAELAQHETDKAADKAELKAQADKQLARQAVLDRLGITADEAALLLG